MNEKYQIYSDFENTLVWVFEYFYFSDERWVLQKRIKWEKRGIPVNNLSLFDFEYKIRKQNEINKQECFSYYTIDFIETNNDPKIRIDCMNNNVGVMKKFPFQHYIEFSISFLNYRFQDNNNKKDFFHFLLSNFEPSLFSLT